MGTNMSSTRYYSPLRYPGGKGKIAGYMKVLLEQNLLLDGDYVEPYAGGASVALDLLVNEYVSNVHINDIDKSIYAFWHCVLHNTREFCTRVKNIELTIDEWQKQKEIQRRRDHHSILDVGFSTFFLNRTNRSGIITAGVIGGLNQEGKWKIDARFTKENLIKRIQKISDYKDRIHLYNEDAVSLVNRLDKELSKQTLFYLDPPYYDKGKELYVNYYKHEDHVEIADMMSDINNRHWLISYDDVDPIKCLYNHFRQRLYSLNYSAAKSTKGSEVLVFSDNSIIPEIENPTSRNEIKQYYSATYT